MEFIKLKKQEQFDNLKKDQLIIVEWKQGASEIKRNDGQTIFTYKFHSINHLNEIILKVKDNVYFSIDNYLSGNSIAKEAYTVKRE